ncbi:MAG: phenylacetate--CoA ligase family protein [Nocardioidaceae bacterium]
MTVTAALHEYRQRLHDRVLSELAESAAKVPGVAARLDGVELSDLAALDAVPVLAKDAVPALQRESPPFGGLLAPDVPVVRMFASPGPIYEAQLAGTDPWNWAPALRACGIGPGDVVLNCFSYHLSPAGVMFDEGCRAVGAAVVPGGVGAAEVQVQVIADLGVTAYIGLPSYLASLVERYDGQGLDPGRWQLAKALVTAEPLPEALRARLRERVPTVLMAYGTAEVGLLGFETTPGDGLAVSTDVYVQLCDPETGRSVPDDATGEVVVTVLRPGYPLLRFGTGDVSRWTVGPDGDLRLAGVLGRSGAAVKVRGMFVHPHQAREVVAGLVAAGGVTAARFVVERTDDRDVLRCELLLTDDAEATQVLDRVTRQVKEGLRVTPVVTSVDVLDDDQVLVDARTWP